ncbi:DUF599 domain-containing protein [Lutimaribacter sp. EGI FJ00015]|uniref:DUF599 domain-containing protein n=1 Tax=Lutimaribacter degradans TaxID=2945989 RepID=A0ACC5ZYE3_9RHOB|nr:DUF599 domain-containing protein [Lutimaribacter sp. EGI FJ00013]MCM2563067.1 DUF599 domain-containing protein [Lutimaribacter sp. EGI FJ00013]MCO0614246.1 DUF599 domain-containing protein [Lutimaribacter sp. EGI FJ00015]MCO0637056.1 DUF599 domain-containing protein [Lutimaribacter sp. EGI FJ00014]
MRDTLDLLRLFTPLDFAAVAGILLAWAGIGWLIENPPASRPSVSRLMARYRREWMRVMVTRQPRIFDAQALGTLRHGTSFFASATMIAIGGAMALIGNADRLQGIAHDLTLGADPRIVWEMKLLLAVFFLANAFLKFVWSHRLFGYCLVLMGSVPNDPEDPAALPRAAQAAEINITAVRGFNRGLRSVYFAFGATAWMLGAIPLLAATAITLGVLWRREFASQSRAVLLRDAAETDTPT